MHTFTLRFGLGAALAALLLGAPLAFVQAQETGATVEATVQVKPEDRPKPQMLPPVPKIGPAIKDIASTTRTNIKAVASTTRANIQNSTLEARAEIKAQLEARGEAIRTLVGEKREAIKELIGEKREAMQERAEAAKEKAKERFGEGVQRSVNAIVERLKAAVERLNNIAERTEARIGKLQAEGLAMTESVELLAEAKLDIAAAGDKVVAVSAALEAALASETPKEQMTAVRAAVKEAEEALRAAKASLGEVLKSIRAEAGASAEVSATTN